MRSTCSIAAWAVYFHVTVLAFTWSDPTCPRKFGSTSLFLKNPDSFSDAIALTQSAATNITAAHEACLVWSSLLEEPSKDNKVQVLCMALYGSCLVRIGDDNAALEVYNMALPLAQTEETRRDVILGKARCLQRLLRYKEAQETFLSSSSVHATYGAATCALRSGDLTGARQLLEAAVSKNIPSDEDDSSWKELNGMLAVINYIQDPSRLCLSDEKRLDAAWRVSPMYSWILSMAKLETPPRQSVNQFIDYCTVNIGAFDDPLLLHLDDKVLLHRLLSRNNDKTSAFWPKGMILPAEFSEWEENWKEDNSIWICKRRSGYGSHGNTLIKASNVAAMQDTLTEELLLQRMVANPLLLKGRKFSLRIYVVLFAREGFRTLPEVYISTSGLVKLASVPVESSSSSDVGWDDMRMHMTNSGRETRMEQHGLDFLRDEMTKQGCEFEELWEKIVYCTRTVCEEFHFNNERLCEHNNELAEVRYKLAKLGIPKILGFDFVVDKELSPWLLEVNRFPGLEPRDEQDATIKCNVVRQAWKTAMMRQGRNLSWFGDELDAFGYMLDASSDEVILQHIELHGLSTTN